MMMRLVCACRKIRVRRTTGNTPQAIMSRSTFPAPTAGSWSVSPTRSRRMDSGTAFNSAFIRIISIIEHSSTTRTSPSSGFFSFFWYPSGGLQPSRRCIVSAFIPAVSDSRFAALPVGAASSTFRPYARKAAIIPCVVVVFPVPGPPVKTITFADAAIRIAPAWASSYSICTICWIFPTSTESSRFPVFSLACISCTHRRSEAGASASFRSLLDTPISA